eukprot:TRINITY_DN11163_c0_g1_i4.p1 TRINITY_DN11163_c0_g1~~TRINITY_DN11163_c0_g1_i4.p1  ORF type:complete len:990 (-),score=157.32 TRINITY_DN11163_c0_g1_i4:433-3402(-)
MLTDEEIVEDDGFDIAVTKKVSMKSTNSNLMSTVMHRMDRLVSTGSTELRTQIMSEPQRVATSAVWDSNVSVVAGLSFNSAQQPHLQLSLRAVVCSLLVLLLASFGVLMPIQANLSVANMELHTDLIDVMDQQQSKMEMLIHQNLTLTSFRFMLSRVGAFIHESIVAPTVNAVDSLLAVVEVNHAINMSWTGRSYSERRLLAAHSRVFLSAYRQGKTGLQLEFFNRQAEATIHPHVSTLRIGFATGEFIITRIVDEERTGVPRVLFIESDGDENMTLHWGHRDGTEQQLPNHPVSGWSCFMNQASIAADTLAASPDSAPTRHSWTHWHQVPGSNVLAVSRAAPLAHCGSYNCFSGIVSADISVGYLSDIVGTALKAMRDAFPGLEGHSNDSSIFVVSQTSENKSQSGMLLGASDLDEQSLQGCLTKASDVPGNNLALVQAASRALALKYQGQWDHPDLLHSELFHFRRSVAAAKEPSYVQCDPRQATIDSDPDCLVAGTRSLRLDNETSWLIVIVMPAYLISQDVANLEREMQETAREYKSDAASKLSLQWALALGALGAVAVFATLVAVALRLFVSKPLRELSDLKDLMAKLGNWELASLNLASSDLTHLREGKRSRVKEVCNLQNAFCRMMCGIESFSRFVPKTVVRDLVSVKSEECSPLLNVRRRTVTIMFSDIANFTTIAESLKEADLLLLLTRYLSVMTSIVERYDGEVAEILGDGLLIFWNTPEDVPDHAEKACMTALAMQAAIPLLNEQLSAQLLPSLQIRVGIHSGNVLSGLIGSAQRLKFGCMGDPVNLASRMEGLCKFFGVSVLCSGATVDELGRYHNLLLRRMGCVQVKGKNSTTMVYEVMGCLSEVSDGDISTSQGASGITISNSSSPIYGGYAASPAPTVARGHSLMLVQEPRAAASTCCRNSGINVSRQLVCDYEAALEAFERSDLSEAEYRLLQCLDTWPEDNAARCLLRLVRSAAVAGEGADGSCRVMKPDEK